jgi:hypothetical protein
MKIYLHIGMHKTGTTAIQDSLEGFCSPSAMYANLWVSSNHSFSFWTAFSEAPHPGLLHHPTSVNKSPNELKKIHFDMIEESLKIALKSDKDIIFSGEDIANLTPNAIESMKNLFNKYTDEIEVISYIREPDAWMVSALQENIRHGNYAGYIETSEQPLYQIKFSKFIDIFGVENCLFKEFDLSLFTNSDVVLDFLDVISVKLSKSTKVTNISSSTEAIKCIYILNDIYRPEMGIDFLLKARRQFIEFISDSLPGKFHIDGSYTRQHLVQSDIEWMEKASGINFNIKKISQFNDYKKLLSKLDSKTVATLKLYLKKLNFNNDYVSDLDLVFKVFITFIDKSYSIKDFSPNKYLELNQDLVEAKIDPYYHFLVYGIAEKRLY